MKNEQEILELLLQGKGYTTIQGALHVSPSSIAIVKKKYYDKLISRYSEARDKSITTATIPIMKEGSSISLPEKKAILQPEKKIESKITLPVQPEKKIESKITLPVHPEKKVVVEQLPKQKSKGWVGKGDYFYAEDVAGWMYYTFPKSMRNESLTTKEINEKINENCKEYIYCNLMKIEWKERWKGMNTYHVYVWE